MAGRSKAPQTPATPEPEDEAQDQSEQLEEPGPASPGAELPAVQPDQPEQLDETATEPVYDERGNVRPRGTEGARPMSYEERVAIAQRLANTEEG